MYLYDFAEQIYFDDKALGKKNTREKTIIRWLKSPVVLVAGILTMFLPENLWIYQNELCDRTKFLIEKKQAGKTSNIFNEENIAVADKLIEKKCKSRKQHELMIIERFNILKNMTLIEDF